MGPYYGWFSLVVVVLLLAILLVVTGHLHF